jgi:hypothetical protein
MREFMGYARSVCDCVQCQTNCKFIPGFLIPADIKPISIYLGMSVLDMATKYLEPSPGALVAKAKKPRPFRIPTIVPRLVEAGCIFFDDSSCTCKIHEVAPFGCAFFDCRMSLDVSAKLSVAGLTLIAKAMMTDTKVTCSGAEYVTNMTTYHIVMTHLKATMQLGMTPEEKRRKMNEHFMANGFGIGTNWSKP